MDRHERLAFFINVYNSLTIHAVAALGGPADLLSRLRLYDEASYQIGPHVYSLNDIESGVLRGNQGKRTGSLRGFIPVLCTRQAFIAWPLHASVSRAARESGRGSFAKLACRRACSCVSPGSWRMSYHLSSHTPAPPTINPFPKKPFGAGDPRAALACKMVFAHLFQRIHSSLARSFVICLEHSHRTESARPSDPCAHHVVASNVCHVHKSREWGSPLTKAERIAPIRALAMMCQNLAR